MIKLSLQVGAGAAPRELAGPILSIGRSRFNDLPLEDRKVSRLHARITKEGGEIRIVDLQSGNGTRVNGRKITENALMTGDRIKIGPFELTVLQATVEGEPQPPPADDVLNETTRMPVSDSKPAPVDSRRRRFRSLGAHAISRAT
jgi:pSer/pThr/pTyr-binding forkhead associated (FHA) protein